MRLVINKTGRPPRDRGARIPPRRSGARRPCPPVGSDDAPSRRPSSARRARCNPWRRGSSTDPEPLSDREQALAEFREVDPDLGERPLQGPLPIRSAAASSASLRSSRAVEASPAGSLAAPCDEGSAGAGALARPASRPRARAGARPSLSAAQRIGARRPSCGATNAVKSGAETARFGRRCKPLASANSIFPSWHFAYSQLRSRSAQDNSP